jgi:hypothetical protein
MVRYFRANHATGVSSLTRFAGKFAHRNPQSAARFNIPIRDYLGSVLPGLADRPISQTTELIPAAWSDRNRSSTMLPSTAV